MPHDRGAVCRRATIGVKQNGLGVSYGNDVRYVRVGCFWKIITVERNRKNEDLERKAKPRVLGHIYPYSGIVPSECLENQ